MSVHSCGRCPQSRRPAQAHLCIYDDEHPAEIFLRLKGSDCSSELIGLYDVAARLMSLALQYGAPLEKGGDHLAGVKLGNDLEELVARPRSDEW